MYSGVKEKLLGIDKVQKYFHDMARRYDCQYLDYSDSEICKDTSNFCVSVHMNPDATNAFSEQFSKDLLDLGLI